MRKLRTASGRSAVDHQRLPPIDLEIRPSAPRPSPWADSVWGRTPGSESLDGVIRTRWDMRRCKGNPTYHNLGDHTETLQIDYDPLKISYEKLLDLFWEEHDHQPLLSRQYKAVVFYHDEEQKRRRSPAVTAWRQAGKNHPHRGAAQQRFMRPRTIIRSTTCGSTGNSEAFHSIIPRPPSDELDCGGPGQWIPRRVRHV